MDADNFPIEIEFLRLLENAAKACSENTDSFASDSSEKLRATLENLGSTLSVIYRLSCCWFGCKGGDHQIEWLAGRVANQAAAAIGLIRSGYYDESLMLTRGIGEISNLLQLFAVDESHLSAWKRSNRRERIFRYSPRAVREALEEQEVMPVAVDRDRYQALCEVGAHPVPGQPPGHYTGTGRPILGGVIQEVGVFVSYTELGFAVALSGVGLLQLLDIEKPVRQSLLDTSAALMRSLGTFTILNYEDLLEEVLKNRSQR